MGTLNTVLAILLFVSAIFLIVAVLMQSGKDKGAGVITGSSSETYFGKNKSKSKEKKLALLTTIVAVIFIILAILAFVLQDAPEEYDPDDYVSSGSGSSAGSKVDTTDSKVDTSDVKSEADTTTDASTDESVDTPDAE